MIPPLNNSSPLSWDPTPPIKTLISQLLSDIMGTLSKRWQQWVFGSGVPIKIHPPYLGIPPYPTAKFGSHPIKEWGFGLWTSYFACFLFVLVLWYVLYYINFILYFIFIHFYPDINECNNTVAIRTNDGILITGSGLGPDDDDIMLDQSDDEFDICGDDYAQCVNTIGSYECECEEGQFEITTHFLIYLTGLRKVGQNWLNFWIITKISVERFLDRLFHFRQNFLTLFFLLLFLSSD